MNDRELRERLVDHLERTGVLTDARVKNALLEVPRHRFIPSISLDEAYDDRALAIKQREGAVISSISQPSMVVQMLQMLDVQPGNSVLEVGTGSGYHAALLATLTGPEGSVVTLDIEPDLVDAARTTLRELNVANVDVRNAETIGELQTTFDRIVVTARADDIDPAWWRLLKDGGRLVVPLDIGYGGERAIGFVREGALLRSHGSYACAFLAMRGNAPEHHHSEVFFPNKNARYALPPPATAPLSVTAVRSDDATAALLNDADIIVAHPATIFALRLRS